MNRSITALLVGIAALFVTVPALPAQQPQTAPKPELTDEFPDEIRGDRGRVEFGYRYFWGDVYGRPDLPFVPDLKTSKLNEYNDIRRTL